MKPISPSLPLLLSLVLAGSLLGAAYGQDAITKDLDRAAELVVSIEAAFGDRTVYGAGIVVARSRDAAAIVTANHVVRQGAAAAQTISVRFKHSPKIATMAELRSEFDRQDDIAVLQVRDLGRLAIDPCALPAPRYEERPVIRRGQGVFPIGNPLGVGWGIPPVPDQVSEVGEQEIRFQSALIDSGHSGGGLFNAFADLVGMIKADQPPYGVAVSLDRVAERLRGWGVAFGTDVAHKPSADACAVDVAQPAHARNAPPPADEVPPRSPASWGLWEDIPDPHEAKRVALFLAVRSGEVDKVQQLVDAQALAPDAYHGPFPLHWAAAFGQIDVSKQLLLLGAKKNSAMVLSNMMPEFGRVTPLHLAARFNQVDAIRVLARAGADLEAFVPGGTPLAAAAYYGQIEAARALIEVGADVNGNKRLVGGEPYVDKDSPSAAAVGQGRIDMVDFLARSNALLISKRDPPFLLTVAVEHDQIEMIHHLIRGGVPTECGADSVMCYTPLYHALIQGKLEVMSALLQHGADPNCGSEVPLEVAMGYKNLPALKLLLKAGADPNRRNRSGESALQLALKHDDPDAAQLLRASGAKE